MSFDREESLFLAFRSRPGRDTLVALLRGHQDHIFNICFQILGHAQDAQDASQEILLEVTRGAGRIENARAFKTWLYRVALHTALNHKKSRSRHADLLRKKADMETRAAGSPPDAEKAAVIDALAALDDESRCLVIEHYFDKATLEELGKRQGVSAAAIWKRIERAKEMLKRSLFVAGFSGATDRVTHALESVTPVPAPAGLVGDLVMTKAALIAAGGMSVGMKFPAAAILCAFLLLGLGLAGGLLMRRTGGGDSARIRELESKLAAVTSDLQVARKPDSAPADPDLGSDGTAGAGPVEASNLPAAAQLKNRLARFKEWRKKANAERAAHSKGGSWTSPEAAREWRAGHIEHLGGLRALILTAPEIFVEFVKDPAHADCIHDLLQFTLGNPDPAGKGGWFGQKYSDFPKELLDGLHEALSVTGAEAQYELLQLFGMIQEAPATYLDRYRSLLTTAESSVRMIAATVLFRDRRARPEDLVVVQDLALSPYHRTYRGSFMEAMTLSSLPEAESWFMSQLESSQDDDVSAYLVRAMGRRAMFRLAQPDNLERVARALPRFLTRTQEELMQWAILEVTAYLPSEKIPAILDQVLANEPSAPCRRAATRMSELYRDGERMPLRLFQAVAEVQENPSRYR